MELAQTCSLSSLNWWANTRETQCTRPMLKRLCGAHWPILIGKETALNSIESESITLLLMSGALAAGKTSVAEKLVSDHGFAKIRSGSFLVGKAKAKGLTGTRTE